MDNSRKTWRNLKKKYVTVEAGTKKYVASNFLRFEMTNEKSVSSLIIEYKKILSETLSEGLDE